MSDVQYTQAADGKLPMYEEEMLALSHLYEYILAPTLVDKHNVWENHIKL